MLVSSPLIAATQLSSWRFDPLVSHVPVVNPVPAAHAVQLLPSFEFAAGGGEKVAHLGL